ncbi:hypothetical protein ROLI_015710 [Roseobacter fucihabitans]|uniref:Uncharacterized protein n=1 Tax=Roseobacter fucihabitans TaxID=1537242 RepID=A0ABZ2BTH2_9RHOB|nr:hypothetical protein [Roseobacter litoralis]MBC6965387.1 hypothetical protein [Roseobacter litoralis]
MADRIKPGLMKSILSSGNWALASGVQEQVLDAQQLFAKPTPKPDPALLVPVDVQALYVPTSHSERYVRLPLELGEGAKKGEHIAPFSIPRARSKGVHLHWALPDGLLRGEMVEDADTPVKMRALPNRWLVVRMSGRQGRSKLDLRTWLIESDKGRVFDLPKYPADAASISPHALDPEQLTGIMGGSPNWTASYDASLNRFAFHDPLDDIDAGQVMTKQASYVVIGWWSERNLDPLAGLTLPYGVPRRIAGFNWTASTAPFITAWQSPKAVLASTQTEAVDIERVDMRSALKLSTSQIGLAAGFREYELDEVVLQRIRARYQTVLHGAVYGVPIMGGVGKDAAPRARDINLSMAPTLERLIAAQAASGMGIRSAAKKEYFEALITAVANTSLMNVATSDGVVALDEAEHGDGFEAFQGPETYEDVIITRQQSALKAGRPLRTKEAKATTPEALRAQVIWNGRVRGKTMSTRDALRRKSEDIKYRIKPGEVVEDGPETRKVRRPGPRYHRPTSPVIGLRNYGRAQRFLGDGRFNDENKLVCRWSDEMTVQYGEGYEAKTYVPPLVNSAVPAIANRIIQNSFMGDLYMMPWIFDAIKAVVRGDAVGQTQNRLRGEMALRYSPDGVYDGIVPLARKNPETPRSAQIAVSDAMRRFSLAEGREPSPVAVTSWVQPWSPVWLEWEVELAPGRGFEGWSLGRIEFDGAPVPQGETLTLLGRSAITSGVARTYQAVIDTYLIAENQRDAADAGEIGELHEGTLSRLAAYLKNADLGSVTLDRINDLWLAIETGPDGQVMPAPAAVSDALRAAGLPNLIADGTLRLTRARIVDSFGRFRDVNTSGITLPTALATKTEGGDTALAMPPRLSLPARLMWRFVDPGDTSARPAEGRLDQATPANMVNPISGYVLPDFIDESLEFFDQTGQPLGEVLHDPITGGLIWEGGVGREGPASGSPRADLPKSARLCGEIAQGMIEADVFQRNTPEHRDKESPLSAFLRAVDTTSWSVDSSLMSAGATIAGLVGRPVAVVMTQLWLDIPEDLAKTGAFGDSGDDIRDHLVREAVFDAVKSRAFKVRLGEIAKGHDGLYGFFIGEDYAHFHLIEKEVAQAALISRSGSGFRALLGGVGDQMGSNALPAPSPLDTPYIGAGEPLSVHVGQKLRLTLLMHPTARVHATTGFLPRKSLELLNDWVSPGLGRVAPSVRIGPVIIDPDRVRLPKIAAFGADQTWTRRNTPITWRDDPILAATQAALLPGGRASVQEGYIRITPEGGAKIGEES